MGAAGCSPGPAGTASFGTVPLASAPNCCLTTAMLPPPPFAAALPPPGPACAVIGSRDTTCTARAAGRACPRADRSPRRSRRSRMGTSAREPAQTKNSTLPAEYMSDTDCIVARLWPAYGRKEGNGGERGMWLMGGLLGWGGGEAAHAWLASFGRLIDSPTLTEMKFMRARVAPL